MRSACGLIVAVALFGASACSDDDDASTATVTSAPVSTVAVTTIAPVTTEPSTTVAVATIPATTQPRVPASTEPAVSVTDTPPPGCPSLTTGVTETTLTAGGADHPLRVFVPSSYAGLQLPVVIDWHGLGSDGPQQAMYSGYETVAEQEGFIVVHPTGVADVAGGANSWQLFTAPGRGRDDLAFAGALIDELVADWCADPGRVYSTGMSNGGFFTARLVCEMADRIAAAVSVAGTYHPDTCEPARDVPYMAIHGTDDKIVPYNGGGESTLAGADTTGELRVFFEQVMPDEFAEFAADAGCDARVDTELGEDVIQHEYTECDGDGPMIFDEVSGGGHTWPSSPMAALTEAALGYTTHDIDATRDGWAFMSQFMLPLD